MIPVYDGEQVVARVQYNSNLDFWDGNNMTCGGCGLHKGLTRLKKSGQYVLIHGTQWQGSKDSAEVISKDEAVEEILRSGNDELFDKYPELKKHMEENLDEEE